MAGKDGGIIVYEVVTAPAGDDYFETPEQHLVFGGNLEEASKYLTDRMGKMLTDPPRQIEAPKRRKRRDALDAIDALDRAIDIELMEGDAD
jgi:hypothetical protein